MTLSSLSFVNQQDPLASAYSSVFMYQNLNLSYCKFLI